MPGGTAPTGPNMSETVSSVAAAAQKLGFDGRTGGLKHAGWLASQVGAMTIWATLRASFLRRSDVTNVNGVRASLLSGGETGESKSTKADKRSRIQANYPGYLQAARHDNTHPHTDK